MVNNYEISMKYTAEGCVRVVVVDWGERMIRDNQGATGLKTIAMQAPTEVEALDSLRAVLGQRQERNNNESAFRAQIATHMARLKNAARADFVEWIAQQHYRLARAENARMSDTRTKERT